MLGILREMNIYEFKHILQCLFRLPREMSTWQFEKIISKYLSSQNNYTKFVIEGFSEIHQ